jgi:AcrR family transcriptional regulator
MTVKEQNILDAALSLFVSNGFHGTPTALIAKKAEVSNGTLFHYHRTMDALVQALSKDIMAEYQEATLSGEIDIEPIKSKVQILWKQSLNWAFENKEKYHFILQYKYASTKWDIKLERGGALKKRFADITEKGIQQKLIAHRPDDFIYTMFESNIYGMLSYLFENPVKYRMPEFMKNSFEWFWNSISVN